MKCSFPCQSNCKAHKRLFSMGAYFWIGAYFPVNTVMSGGLQSPKLHDYLALKFLVYLVKSYDVDALICIS